MIKTSKNTLKVSFNGALNLPKYAIFEVLLAVEGYGMLKNN